jgi:hypothetical protein
MSTRADRFRPKDSAADDKRTSLTYFQINKFEGAKESFQRFEDELKTQVQSELGINGRDFLFTVWPGNIPNNIRYEIREVPDSLDGLNVIQGPEADGTLQVDAGGNPVMIVLTAEMRKDRREERKAVLEFNEKIEEMERKCFKILSDRCNDALNQQFLTLHGDPIAIWAYLRENFGPISRGPQEEGGAFIKFIETEMKYNQRFSNFMVEFRRKMEYSVVPENAALGLLQSDGTSEKGLQILPDRLMESVKRSKEMRHDFAEFIPFMIQQDDMQHQKGNLEENKKKSKISVVKSSNNNSDSNSSTRGNYPYKCLNCQNHCHRVAECLSPFCGWCKKFDCGHRSDTCPDRLKKMNNRNNNSKNSTGKSNSNSSTNVFDKKRKARKFDSDNQVKKKKKKVKHVSADRDDEGSDSDDDDDSPDDDDSEDEYDDEDSDDDDEEVASSRGKNVFQFHSRRNVRAVRYKVSRPSTIAVIDSGCEENCMMDKSNFKHIIQEYSDSSQAGVSLL